MRHPSALALLVTLAMLAAAPAAAAPPALPVVAAASAEAELVRRAERIRRLHLATVGLDAALGTVLGRLDRAEAAGAGAQARLEQASQAVRRLRRTVQVAAGKVAAIRLAADDGQNLARRRAALRAAGQGWQRQERALAEADAALARLGRERAQGQATLAVLDRLGAAIGQERAGIDDVPLAVLALDLRRLDQLAALEVQPSLLAAAGDEVAALELAAPASAGLAQDLHWPDPADDALAPAAATPGWDGLLAELPAQAPPVGLAARGGIVLQAPAGGVVLAPEAGKVVFAGPFRSYGRILIIDHGNGYHTLMAGFARLDVAGGAVVRAGERIGTMDAGSQVPGRLYVEVRRKGVPVDPMPWLAAREDKVRG